MDSVTITISCHDFRIIKLTFTGMGTTSNRPITQFTELGDLVAAASSYTELKNESLFVCLNCCVDCVLVVSASCFKVYKSVTVCL